MMPITVKVMLLKIGVQFPRKNDLFNIVDSAGEWYGKCRGRIRGFVELLPRASMMFRLRLP